MSAYARQVMGTPLTLSQDARVRAFERGAEHVMQGNPQPGYYIGRGHKIFSEVRIVKSISKGEPGYLEEVPEGVSGFLVNRGNNLMSGYVNNPEASAKAIDHENGGWYTNLGDVCFWLKSETDGEQDVYWMSRESSLLIRGGANYAYDQINEELRGFLKEQYGLGDESISVAVIGLRINSEHDDDCCATIELKDAKAIAQIRGISDTFLSASKKAVSKGAKPDCMRFGKIPRTFKGSVLNKDLVKSWKATNGNHDTAFQNAIDGDPATSVSGVDEPIEKKADSSAESSMVPYLLLISLAVIAVAYAANFQ